MTHKASIHCHKQHSNRDPDRIELEIRDEASRHIVCRIYFSLEEFGDLITGRTLTDHPIKWVDTDHIGWRSTNEDHIVWGPSNATKSQLEAAAQNKAIELEEAEPGVVVSYRSGDLGNFHRRVKDEDDRVGYSVVFWTLRPPEAGDG